MPKKVTAKTAQYYQRHPWNRWFAKPWSQFSICEGVDFGGRTYSMAQQIRNMGSARKVRVSVQIDGSTIHVSFPDKKRVK